MFRRYLRRTGFRSQLTLILSPSILGLALFSSLINSWEASARMRAYFIEQGQRVADNLARQSTLALLFHSAENARDVVGATLAFPDVAGVQISDAKHHVLLAKLQQGVTLDPAAAGQAALTRATLVGENGDAWVFGAPVYGGQAEEASPFDVQEHQPQLLGYVHVQIGKDTLHRLTWSLLLSNLAITLSFAAILLLLVGLLARHMINPLNALSALMRRAEAGESGMRAAPAGPRDLIEMGQAFNQMMNVLEQREEELTGSRDAAVSMARMKAQFAATVSHEVRTPLNGVVGMLDMLKETQLTARQQEQVDVAWNSSRTLIELINNILDFSKMEAGKLTLEEHEFDLRKLVEEVIDLVARPAQQKGIDVGYLLAPGTPERVSGDSLRLRQILINLLGNAVKFTERGEVALHVQAAELAAAAGEHADDKDGAATRHGLRFAVRDTGIGISEPAQRQLFVSFAQSEPSTTRRYGGTGLGLAICKQLVGLLGGDIGVSSTPGFGTSFVFTIGCTPVATAQPHDAAPPHDAGLSGVRVLAVDNSAIVRAFLQDLLTRHGALHHVGASGDMALAELKHADAAGHPYQLVILDVAATDERGADLACRIEASGLTPHLLLLLDRHGRHGGNSVSGHATLGKPLRQDRLLAALRELLAGRRHTETARLPGAAAPGRLYRVLVAEDNRTNQMVAAAMLAMHGCQCEFAFNGREAVDAAQRQRYDLILMDCSMPEMDGYEATAHIRAAEEALGRRTPLVAMTANTQRGDAEKCLAAGMDDYLAKPITLIELRHKLDKWLPHGDAHAYATEHDAAPSDNAPEPVDRALFGKLRELLGSTLAHAVTPFLEDTPVYLDELEQALRSGDIEAARARAHALKGSSGNLGAVLLAQLAGQGRQAALRPPVAADGGVPAGLARRLSRGGRFPRRGNRPRPRRRRRAARRGAAGAGGRRRPQHPQHLALHLAARRLPRRRGGRRRAGAGHAQALPARRDPDGRRDAGDGRFHRLRAPAGHAGRRIDPGADDHRAAGQFLGRARVRGRRQRLYSQAHPLRRAVAAGAPHHRGQPRREAHPPPGLQRRADRPAEPHAVLRAAGAGHRPGRVQPAPAGRAVHGPGPLQVRQRQPGP